MLRQLFLAAAVASSVGGAALAQSAAPADNAPTAWRRTGESPPLLP